ncbi:MAG TPA: alpha-amylase family glycosyl hydrolase [Povalibacter sp.]|uniref:alpha-amylase family glycosyl hydrolase n=1 Tax=Povalibacter sp. TaxID=1962978 RepID=UPI002CF2C13B|nr:alpha-amylase family glycosyl hydrolase [Povalibacter sp.]HMN45930.1 alpha-amylase family glycosyl hydrolase [Povalibacter sp.]
MRSLLSCALLGTLLGASVAEAQSFRDRPPEDEVIYFLLPDRFENGDPRNDRGGLNGDRLKTGFDPTHKGFFHGGDLEGLISRLDYIQSLGATAIWLGPIYRNKPVQGAPGQESAGYHGYWITDFTRVDPHYGSNADMKAVVDAAHARGMKVYLDIITNHTADVIAYRECASSACEFRAPADFPYSRRGGLQGEPINAGFLGEHVQTAENFAKLTRPDYAYTPFVPAAEVNVKVPAWLNDPIWYHNRGNTTFRGESTTLGDFVGLDDLMTENPRVVDGFIDIYGRWIEEFGIDGFRIDTARHVNPEFWQRFVPAMLERAQQRGIPNFHIFGEVSVDAVDPVPTARATRVDRLPSVLDFAFAAAVIETVAGNAGTRSLADLFKADALYEGSAETVRQLPTFISNHDAGRFAGFARRAFPAADDAQILARTTLAHAMLLLLRGVPVIYSGDEQGFAGDGNDQDAREDLFASRVASYNDNCLVGTNATTAQANFDVHHPLYRAIAGLARLRSQEPALRRGTQIPRRWGDDPGLFAVSRVDPQTGREVVVAFNTSTQALEGNVEVDARAREFVSLHGDCAPQVSAPGSYRVKIAALDFVVCGQGGPLPNPPPATGGGNKEEASSSPPPRSGGGLGRGQLP